MTGFDRLPRRAGATILLATTELGVDSWVTELMKPAMGKFAPWLLVYTSFIMMVLRFGV